MYFFYCKLVSGVLQWLLKRNFLIIANSRMLNLKTNSLISAIEPTVLFCKDIFKTHFLTGT